MVKRYNVFDSSEDEYGFAIAYSDYAALQAALREALERWTELHHDFVASTKTPNRVQQLRAQFLDDK